MIVEEEFLHEQKPITIFESLLQQKSPTIDLDKDITISYKEGKEEDIISKIKDILIKAETNKNINFSLVMNQNEENDGAYENNIFAIKFKDIYIGGISPNFQMREGFGLNKYDDENSFYLGKWSNNMKEGLGCLKIDTNNIYIGNFHQNQFDGEGILKISKEDRNLLYLGQMSNGEFNEGIYIDIDKDLYYIGKFNNGKKNDDFCVMIEKNNRQIFVGKVNDDIFEQGYLCLYNIEEIKRQDQNGDDISGIKFDIEKIFYYYKDQDDQNQFIHEFDNTEILERNMNKIFAFECEITKQIEDFLNYFSYSDILVNDEDFNNLLRYNDKDDNSLFFIFSNNYNVYIDKYHQIKENFDINEIKNDIDISSQIFQSQNEN